MRILVAVGLLFVSLSGCLDAYNDFEEFDSDAQYLNPGVFTGDYVAGRWGSMPLATGTLRAPVNPEIVVLESDRPAYGQASLVAGLGGLASSHQDDSRVDIVMAIWHPDNFTGERPIIVDAGPYYELGTSDISVAGQSSPFLIQNMLPHGYTVVQIAVRGTGTSGGCMDLLGPDETADLDQALTWLGEQEWSNGNIGMMGVSYDGSTPWTAASTGNPYLKTIVPISGLPDIYDLMLRNGSAETRAAIMHGTGVYWGYGFHQDFPQAPEAYETVDETLGAPWPVPPAEVGQASQRAEYQDRQNLLCAEAYEGQVVGQASAAEGSRLSEATAYWQERDYRQRVIDNYDGSIFLIHGLQDWNVDPHAAIPFNQDLRAAGFDMKEWYGQWDHAAPDSNCGGGQPSWVVLPCRLDYGDILYRWFETYLNNTPWDLGPEVQIQDNLGYWRNVDSYPPQATWQELQLSVDGNLGGAQSGEVLLPGATGMETMQALKLVSEPFEDGLHFSGMPQIKLPFSVNLPGGQISAWLFDMDPDGAVRSPAYVFAPVPGTDVDVWQPAGIPLVGHGQMNLRFYPGGDERQELVPDEQYVAQVELEPLDVHIPKGHRLMLWVFQMPYPEHQDSGTRADVTLHLDASAVLRLPVVDIDPRTVFPVPGVSFPESTYEPRMYVVAPGMADVGQGTDAALRMFARCGGCA